VISRSPAGRECGVSSCEGNQAVYLKNEVRAKRVVGGGTSV
jgi:hypothetical protein